MSIPGQALDEHEHDALAPPLGGAEDEAGGLGQHLHHQSSQLVSVLLGRLLRGREERRREEKRKEEGIMKDCIDERGSRRKREKRGLIEGKEARERERENGIRTIELKLKD